MMDFNKENNHCPKPLRIQKKDNLSCRRSQNFSIILLVSFLKLAMVISSCQNNEQIMPTIIEEEITIDNNVDYEIKLKLEDTRIQKLDIMIYGLNDLRELEAHISVKDISDSYKFRLPKGDKIVVLVANYPQELKQAQILKYDTCLNLEASFDNNQEQYPIMVAEYPYSSNLIIDSLSVLISKVVICNIINNLDDYELVENIRFRLCDLNSSIRCFDKEYYAMDYIDYGLWKTYQYDIGLEPQNPNIELFCYPNSNEAFCTRLEVEYMIMGTKQKIFLDLPIIDLSSEINVELIINDIDDNDAIITSISYT